MVLLKKEVNNKEEVLSRLILSRINAIRRQRFEDKTIDKFSVAFRVFLLRYLNLSYEFTLEELANELDKAKMSREMKDSIIRILTLLTEVKYEDRQISIEEFKGTLNDAENIVKVLAGSAQEEAHVEEKPFAHFLHKLSLFGKEKVSIQHPELDKRLDLMTLQKQRLEEIKKKREQHEKLKLEEIRKKEEYEKQKELQRSLEEANKISQQIEREEEPIQKIETKKPILEKIREITKKPLILKKEKAVAKEPITKKPFFKIKKEKKHIEEDLKEAKETKLIVEPKKVVDIELIRDGIQYAKDKLRENDFEEAKRIYVMVMKLYNYLDDKQKKEIYKDLNELYYDRKSREKWLMIR